MTGGALACVASYVTWGCGHSWHASPAECDQLMDSDCPVCLETGAAVHSGPCASTWSTRNDGGVARPAWYCVPCDEMHQWGAECEPAVHPMCAKMSEPTTYPGPDGDEERQYFAGILSAMVYCRNCNAFHIADCPYATRGGTIPNPYGSISQPEPTEAEKAKDKRDKALQRAVGIVSRS